MGCGSAAAVTGQLLTYPLDTVRRRMQLNGAKVGHLHELGRDVSMHLLGASMSCGDADCVGLGLVAVHKLCCSELSIPSVTCAAVHHTLQNV